MYEKDYVQYTKKGTCITNDYIYNKDIDTSEPRNRYTCQTDEELCAQSFV